MTEFTQLLTQLLSNKLFWIILVCYYLGISAIGAMEPPDVTSGKLYRFAYRFLQKFAANFDKAADALKVPHASDTPKG